MKINKATIVEVDDYSIFNIADSKAIVITATQNLKKNEIFSSAHRVVSFADLINEAQNYVDYTKCINNTELRFLINKAIVTLFDGEKQLAYKNSIYGLEDLYSLLLLNNISAQSINIDFNEYSFVEKDIFTIYKSVCTNLQQFKQDILKSALIKNAVNILKEYDTVVFVGFVFFNDMQECLIKSLNSKNLVFINKHSDFISSELLKPLLLGLGYNIEQRKIAGKRDGFFNQLEDNIFTQSKINLKTEDVDKIKIYEPFSSREEEFKFIAKQISDKIKILNPEVNQLNSILEDFAIVITKNKDELLFILDDVFSEVGVFVPKDTFDGCLKPIYYEKQNFLNEDIEVKGRKLGYIDKLKLFNDFKRISFIGYNSTEFETTFGKFIISIYKVVAKDLDLDTFKLLLETQWNLDKKFEENILTDFHYIESYFEQLKTLAQWKECVNKLIKLKSNIKNEENFKAHPLHKVQKSTLIYIQKFLSFIEALVNKLKVNGNIKQHIKLLISVFNLNKIKLNTSEDKQAIEILLDGLNKVKCNDSIEVDYVYFAENIKDLLSQCLYVENKKKDDYKLAVVNMENYTKYDYVYFPLFEENKYPRILKNEFPYTNDIIEILQKLNLSIQKNYMMDYHLKMSRHIFKNLFGFVEKQITFTYICKENNNYMDISNYAYEIQKTLNSRLIFEASHSKLKEYKLENRELIFKNFNVSNINLNQLLLQYLCPKLFVYNCLFKNKISYSDKFLLVFYAKALITNRFFTNLGKINKKYNLNSKEFEQEVYKIYLGSLLSVLKYFEMLGENEKKDIRITCRKYIDDFIELHFKSGKFSCKNCKFKIGKRKVIFDRFNVCTRETLIMLNLDTGQETEFDISKNLDFLVNSSGGKKFDFKHFDELVFQLEHGSKFDDKTALINYISFKLNTQLNHKKFYQDGIKRISKIINNTSTIYSNMCDSPSSYCRFCILKDICKGSLIDE